MKNLILAIAVILVAASCQKQVVDCDQVQSECKYIQYSFSDCTPNGSELGWDYDYIYSDTIQFSATGCPDVIEAQFLEQAEKTANDKNTPENVRVFTRMYPSTCDCD